MKKIVSTLVIQFIISIGFLQAQTTADSSYENKISLLETKISKMKELPKDEQKKYFAVLSDVENRKNTMKFLLKTPVEKRDKSWEEKWMQNYSKASTKLDAIQVK